MLKEFNLEMGEVWNYDPHRIIFNRRKDINDSAYVHEYRSELEWKTNFDSWTINT